MKFPVGQCRISHLPDQGEKDQFGAVPSGGVQDREHQIADDESDNGYVE